MHFTTESIEVEGALFSKYRFLVRIYLFNFPSTLTGIVSTAGTETDVEKFLDCSYLTPLVLLVDIIGWGLLGAFGGALSSLILKWRNEKY
jgi:hypothetical protein